MTPEKEGIYWIRILGVTYWVVSEFQDGRWWFIGGDENDSGDSVLEIGSQILLSPAKQEQHLKDALKPFYLLSKEVLKLQSKRDESVLYAYNKAEIIYSDLRKTVEVYEAIPPPPVDTVEKT